MTTIYNWKLVEKDDPYTPPEFRSQYISGKVINHADQDRFPDGDGITTSRIVDSDQEARTVTTRSGSVYVLGPICPDYEAWCRANGYANTFPTFKDEQ